MPSGGAPSGTRLVSPFLAYGRASTCDWYRVLRAKGRSIPVEWVEATVGLMSGRDENGDLDIRGLGDRATR
jgi:hypothetical protein